MLNRLRLPTRARAAAAAAALLLCAPAGNAQDATLTVTLGDTPRVREFVIDPLTDVKGDGKKWEGTGRLVLDDCVVIPLEVTAKVKFGKDKTVFKAKTPGSDKPYVRLKLKTDVALGFVKRVELKLKLEDEEKVKQKDEEVVALNPPGPRGPFAPYALVDTGQSVHYDDDDVMTSPPGPGEPFFGQDADHPGNVARYVDNGDGTVTDGVTGLMWQQTPALYDKVTYAEAVAAAGEFDLACYEDWRLPTLKELYSLIDFRGSSATLTPYIDTDFFDFRFGDESLGERVIDGQYWSSTEYVGRTIMGNETVFGVNFGDGRIKGYPRDTGPGGVPPSYFVRYVRGNPDYGTNEFVDNRDGTVTDRATGLMWQQADDGVTRNWEEALAYAETATVAGHGDWRLPTAKELQSIVDYTRAPDAVDPESVGPAIDPIFDVSETESWFWTGTTLLEAPRDLGPGAHAVYVTFGQAWGNAGTVNVHGAGAQRSDPKSGDPGAYPDGFGPQGDEVRIFNHVRLVRDVGHAGRERLTISGALEAPGDLNELPLSVTVDGAEVDVDSVFRPTRQEICFDFDTAGLAPGERTVEVVFAEPAGVQTGAFTVHANVLLLIVDDWGHDSSPIDNTDPDALLANMPNLATLAAQGVRFTRAHSQPSCSPMRATMMTGRQVFQHGVGSPEEAGSFSTDEMTLPEILTAAGAPHDMLTVGKWHLGGNARGYAVRGGWPEFYGINSGGVGDYLEWEKNSNGTVDTSRTYTTTDQVDEAKTFIDANAESGTPWFAWVAFNAPHTPFHDPPTELAPPGGYSVQADGESTRSHQYRKALEALDTELGRLLESVDPAQTNVILLGDNGSPAQVAQAPYGSGHSKGTLYSGGSHVPMVVAGPAVTLPAGSTDDTLVHCIDVFSTILELTGVDESAVAGLDARDVLSTSIVPVLGGTDVAERYVAVERGADDPGRAIVVGSHPDYKLIVNGDPDDPFDTPTLEFYNIGAPAYDVNEQSPLDVGALTGAALAAFDACLAKDTELGGGYSDPPQN